MNRLTDGARSVGRVWFPALLVCLLVGKPTTLLAQEKGGAADKKSSQAALTAYSDAASYQNRNFFELASEDWARFLSRFPDDPLAAKAQHYRGVCLVQLKQYTEAVRAMQTVVTKYPKFELLEETLLNLGWSQYSLAQEGDDNWYGHAVETFTKLDKEFPQGKYVDQALFFKAESLYALGKKKDAALSYGKLVTAHEDSQLRADALYALGVTLEEMGQWQQAKKSYEMFLADYEKNELGTEVRMRLAESVLQGGDSKAAEAIFAKVAATDGFEAADQALMRQAYCVAQQGNDLKAGELYASLVKRFPRSANVPEATLAAARSYYRTDQMDDAAQWLDKTLEQGGDGVTEAAHWRCRIYLQGKQAAEALKLADKALAAAEGDTFIPNLRLDRADALYELEGRRSEAMAEYAKIAEAFPENDVAPAALYNAAFAALDLKEYDRATQLAGQYLAEHPDHSLTSDVRYIVAECKIQSKAYEEAEAIYRQIVDSADGHSELPLWQVRYGLVLYLQKKYQEVVDWLTPLTTNLKPAAYKAEALYLVGASKYQLKQYDAALPLLRDSLLTDASWRQADETLLYLARAQRQLGQLSDATASLESLLKSYADSEVLDQVFYQLGEFQYASNRFADAIAAYDQLLQKYGESTYVPFALYGKGWSQMKSGQFEPAVSAFTELIEKHDGHSLQDDARFARGMCHRQVKKYEEAIADIDAYLSTNPTAVQQADALYERGLAEAADQQFQKAVATFSELLKNHADYAGADKVHYELAWAYKSLPDEAGATKAFQQLTEKFPKSALAAEASFHIGESAYAAKDYNEAAKAYAQAAKVTGSVLHEKAVYKLGWSHYQLKQNREALTQFETLLKAHGDGELASDAWFMKGECLFRLKDFKQSLPAFREAMKLEASSPQIEVLRQLHAAQAAGQLQQWQESVALLDGLITNHTDSGFLEEAYFERGQGKLKLNQGNEAIEDFQQAADRSRGAVGVRSLFMIGEIEFQQKRYDDAVKDFQRAMFRAVPENAAPEIGNWQAKAGFEAGRCSEVQISNAETAALRAKRIADAKKFYQYVVQSHAQHELAAEAKKRLAALAKLTP